MPDDNNPDTRPRTYNVEYERSKYEYVEPVILEIVPLRKGEVEIENSISQIGYKYGVVQ